MGGGETYVEITGGAVNNGIMTLAGSTEGGGGEEGTAWHLYWNSSGYMGQGWGDTPILEWWSSYTDNTTNGYEKTHEGLASWIDGVPIYNLDSYFNYWDTTYPGGKGDYVTDHLTELSMGNCVELIS